MKNEMPYEEYKKLVWDFLSEYGVAKAYPEDAKRVFEEFEGRTKKHYESGRTPGSTAWGLSLLI